jgi:imidazolonepropionase-like amidohydrolase
VQAGLSRDDAFLALTLWPAEMYGVGRRIGTLSPGADADLVIWTGDPFSLTARVEQAYVEGEPVLRPPEVAPRDDKAAGRLSSRAGGGGA